jgi:hypothetical protein
MTVQYKGFEITRERKDGNYDALRAESNDMEYAFYGTSFEDVINWIDHKWDGKEPEMYFAKY